MKPISLLSCLFAIALTTALSAEEPGRPDRGGPDRPPEGGRPPERREEAARPKPEERGPAPEVRRGEPAREAPHARPGPDRRPDAAPQRGPERQPEPKRGEARGRDEKRPGPDGREHKPEHPQGPQAGRGEGGRPHPQQRGPRGNPREHHVMEAVKHLHAAGLHELAGLLAGKVQGPGHHPHPRMAKPGMKPPFAHMGRPGPRMQGREGPQGPRPEGGKRPEGPPPGGPQRG